MKDWIGYCGLDCETCEARIATANNDDALRCRVAKRWSELNGAEITPEMINCTGCRIDGAKTPYCASLCPIRKCAQEKNVETCGSCHEMAACIHLAAMIRNNPDAYRNLTGYTCIALRDRPDLLDAAAVDYVFSPLVERREYPAWLWKVSEPFADAHRFVRPRTRAGRCGLEHGNLHAAFAECGSEVRAAADAPFVVQLSTNEAEVAQVVVQEEPRGGLGYLPVVDVYAAHGDFAY